MATTIRVSIKAALREGREGWMVSWVDGAERTRRYFVLNRGDAKQTKARAKEGRLPSCWAVRT